MKKVVNLFFILIAFWVTSMAQSGETGHHFETANQLYLDGKFDEAKESYLKIVGSGLESPELYYNLANTYYKLGVIPSAILYYEKALKLKPNDEEIIFNLDLANQLITDKIEELPSFFFIRWVKSLATTLPSDVWSWVSISLFLIMLGLLLWILLSRFTRYRKALMISVLFLAILSITTFFFARGYHHHITRSSYGIIFEPAIKVKSTPDDGGTDLFILHEGTKVKLGDSLGEWTEIKLSDGNAGWIMSSAFKII